MQARAKPDKEGKSKPRRGRERVTLKMIIVTALRQQMRRDDEATATERQRVCNSGDEMRKDDGGDEGRGREEKGEKLEKVM